MARRKSKRKNKKNWGTPLIKGSEYAVKIDQPLTKAELKMKKALDNKIANAEAGKEIAKAQRMQDIRDYAKKHGVSLTQASIALME